MTVAAPIPTGLFYGLVAILLAVVVVCVLGILFEVFKAAVEWWDRWRYGL
jgi:hypothetical protein